MTETQALALALVKRRKQVWAKSILSEMKSDMHPLLGGFNPNREFNKLEEKGFLTSNEISDAGTKYKRRIYTITASGRSAIRKYQKHLLEVQAALSRGK